MSILHKSVEVLPYSILEQEIVAILNTNNYWILATAADNRVTARSMSIANDGLTVYFQTEMCLDKVQQIAKNPRVALCFQNVQIEGTAIVKGHVSKQDNQAIRENYCKRHNNAYQRWCYLEQQVFVEVQPILITLWKYIEARPCRDFLQITETRAFREYYHPEAYTITEK